MRSERDPMSIQPLKVSPVPRISLSEAEAAEALSVSPAWLRAAAVRGEIPSVKIGGRRLYPVDAIVKHLAELVEQSPSADPQGGAS